MESLLQHLRMSGIDNVSFMAINYRGYRARAMIDGIQTRVSFPVYQDHLMKKVWNVLEGNKDDMFVYDTCGRLAYYLPFPLSIIHEEREVVKAAIISTYLHSPCGNTCAAFTPFTPPRIPSPRFENSSDATTMGYKDQSLTAVNETENGTINSTDSQITTLITTETENYITDNFTEDYIYNTQNRSNDILLEATTSSTLPPLTDEVTTADSILNRISFSFRIVKHIPILTTVPDQESGPQQSQTSTPDQATEEAEPSTSSPESLSNQTEVSCVNDGKDICEDWSRRRLRHADKCCPKNEDGLRGHRRSRYLWCRSFSKKYCRKMNVILECCLKSKEDPEEQDSTTAAQDQDMCCKLTPSGKECFPSGSAMCNQEQGIQIS